ncbi:MAG: TolC family protein [Planctomycetes bacterium]|nr:TolC family protein [Planctomycetota bacterium]
MRVHRIAGLLLAASLTLSACTSAARNQRNSFERYDEARLAALSEALKELPDGGSAADTPDNGLTGTLDLDQLVRQAEVHSPRLAAAYEKWRGAVAGITFSTALPDATFSYTEFIRSIETRLGPIERRFMLQQGVPNPGKLVAREEQAAGQAAAMQANFEATRLGLRESLVLAYIELQSLDARLEILRELAQTLRSIEEVIEARVTASLAPQSALLRVQVEAQRLESDAESLEKRRPAIAAALTAIVGTRVSSKAHAAALSKTLPANLPEEAKLVALAIDHPSVQEEFARMSIADAKVNEAGWMWVPDMFFGVEYQMVGKPDIPSAMLPNEYGEDAVAVTVGLTIPWQFHVNLSRGDMARAERQAAKFMVDQRRLDIHARLEQQLFAWSDAARLVELYDGTVLPKARQTLELVRSDFTADSATLTDVLDSERALLAAELSLVNSRVDLLKAEARIESIVARDLETIQ